MKNLGQTKRIAFMALYAALYIVLWYIGQFIPFLRMPQGGSIEIEMAAIFVASYHLGWKSGLVTALLSWVIEFMMGGASYFLNPMQYALDYLIPFIVCAIASAYWKGKGKYVVGVVVGMLLKYISTVLSGVYFWAEGEAAGTAAAWTYSLGYNAWYNLATCIVCIIIVPLLLNRLEKAKVTG